MIAGGFVNRRETGGRFQEALCFSEGLDTQTRSRLKAFSTSACLLCGWFRSRSLVLDVVLQLSRSSHTCLLDCIY